MPSGPRTAEHVARYEWQCRPRCQTARYELFNSENVLCRVRDSKVSDLGGGFFD